MKKLKFILRYLAYLRKSKTKYSIHSPFVYDFITNVLEDKTKYNAYKLVEEQRKKLRKNNSPVEVIDFGAVAKMPYSTYFRKVKQIARKTEQPKKFSKLLFRLSKFAEPKHMIELGTSLGLSTISLSLGSPECKIKTIEGCASVASIADENFKKLKLENIDILIGNFDKILPKLLKGVDNKLDFVFFDGNHRKEPTIEYFKKCIQHVNNHSVFVFDDIHWSSDMEEAWDYIKSHDKISITIDLFFMGIVFFRKGISGQDFVLRF